MGRVSMTEKQNKHITERCFAYQNTKTQEWLKIDRCFNIYSERYDYSWEAYSSFHRSVIYSARNIIEEDFFRLKLKDREDWQLMKIEIEYNIFVAE
jgi:hypothetical protein